MKTPIYDVVVVIDRYVHLHVELFGANTTTESVVKDVLLTSQITVTDYLTEQELNEMVSAKIEREIEKTKRG